MLATSGPSPIVMTTIAMGAGMLPIALGSSASTQAFGAPMAIVGDRRPDHSTFLSLLVIPVLFTYVDDAVQGLQRLFHRRAKPAPAVETTA